MSGIPRHLASVFASGTKWSAAFAAITDDSPILLVGMAEWIGASALVGGSDLVYYMVTVHGLHVGQKRPGGGFLRRAEHVDHFLPKDEIVGLDTDFMQAIEFDVRDGSRVLLRLNDGFSQLGPDGMAELPAPAQMEVLANSLGWEYDRQPAAN